MHFFFLSSKQYERIGSVSLVFLSCIFISFMRLRYWRCEKKVNNSVSSINMYAFDGNFTLEWNRLNVKQRNG